MYHIAEVSVEIRDYSYQSPSSLAAGYPKCLTGGTVALHPLDLARGMKEDFGRALAQLPSLPMGRLCLGHPGSPLVG